MTFYDCTGAAVAYSDDGEAIYLYTGEPVAYLNSDSVFAYSGRHLGFFEDGWVRDHHGMCVFFSENSQGGPVRPVRGVTPVRSARGVLPVRGVRQVPPVRAVRELGWSPLSGRRYWT